MKKLSINSEKYKRGLEYEVFCECVTMEMAYHGARLDKAGDDTEEGRLHFAAMKSLKELRDSVSICDESTIKRAWLVFDAMKAERNQAANQPTHIPLAENKNVNIADVLLTIDSLLPKAIRHDKIGMDLKELQKIVSSCEI